MSANLSYSVGRFHVVSSIMKLWLPFVADESDNDKKKQQR